MSVEQNEVVPERQTRSAARENPGNIQALFHEYLLRGDLKTSVEKVCKEIQPIVSSLKEALTDRLSPFVNDPLFKSVAVFLDTSSYSILEVEDLFSHIDVIVAKFKSLLVANQCDLTRVKSEMELIYEHVTRFLSGKSSEKIWAHLFARESQLGIPNVLHLAEIGIAIPTSNAETERVFSFMWRVFSKDRQSLKNRSMENIIRLRCNDDYSPEKYKDAVDRFLNEHPNGEIRKMPRRPDGHNYPQERKKKKPNNRIRIDSSSSTSSSESEEERQQIEDIPLDDISSDEWTDSDSD